MTSESDGIKQITIRWPEGFWETVRIESTKRRTSVQTLVTQAVAEFLKIEAPKASAA